MISIITMFDGYNKIFSSGNMTTFINELEQSLMIVFSKDNESVTDLDWNTFTEITINDRYSKYKGIATTNVEIMIIKPYLQQDYDKYVRCNKIIVDETIEYYNTITLPNAIKTDKQWIYEILDNGAEKERIIYEDNNFVLIQDMKWPGLNINDIHILAVIRRKDILSIRDLDETNVNLIEKIDEISKQQIFNKYNIPIEKIRSYFHYHPSFWHLHIHFNTYGQIGALDSIDNCKQLHDVVQNIKLCPDYYKRVILKIVTK
jgi:m7GpppX diphosphatase